ncbi:hypothetical protein ACIPXV_27610 [Streptomyces libani]|uniref:hypothetical protein n=1 Tax=Streptomyces nigrescens TaxID=1920 RepID=UPI0037F87424
MNSRDSTSVRDGYERIKVKHGIDDGNDGCSTHNASSPKPSPSPAQPTIEAGFPTFGDA